VRLVSGVSGAGVRDMVMALGAEIRAHRAGARTASGGAETDWRP
jgi:hypothetical protein